MLFHETDFYGMPRTEARDKRERAAARSPSLSPATFLDVPPNPHDVLATREVRAQLPALLKRFRYGAGATLDAEEAMQLADSELHAIRRQR